MDAAFTLPAALTPVVPDYEDAVKDGAIGVDLNAGHLSLWRLDVSGNPVGTPKDVLLDMDGHSTSTRDGHLRAAISETLRYARECGVQAIVVEDLGFDDARSIGRETMGRGQRGKREVPPGRGGYPHGKVQEAAGSDVLTHGHRRGCRRPRVHE